MESVLKYFKNLDADKKIKLDSLFDIYSELNRNVNLISRKDLAHLYINHVLHSLSILKFIDIKPNSVFIDVGTGGGFPGIPLAICCPDSSFVLLDSTQKKIKAVETIRNQLKLENVECFCQRAENYKGKFDYVTGRAVASLPKFIDNVKHLLKNKNSSVLYLKGGDFEDELKLLNMNYIVFNIKDVFEEDYFETKKLVKLF